ncbi:MAG: SDR family oxidoreductase [Planctomycetota bacterium]
MSVQGRTIYITGATRGIGRTLALACAKRGAKLAICGRDAELLREITEICRETTQVFSQAFDLLQERGVVTFYREATREIGAPDVLVNNAGFNHRKAPVADVGTEEFDNILGVNLRAPFLLMRQALPDMVSRGSGHVINVLSTVCKHPSFPFVRDTQSIVR